MGTRDRLSAGGFAGGLGVRRSRAKVRRVRGSSGVEKVAGSDARAQIRGVRGSDGVGKMASSSDVGKVAGSNIHDLGVHGHQIDQGEEWIVVRGHRIRRASLRINSQGDVYVPDSEEEDAGMETKNVVAEGAAAVKVATPRSLVAVVGSDMGSGVVVPTDKASAMEVAVDRDPAMELAPEVQAHLEAVLAGLDPLYHDVFISMYKVMVPAFFKSN